MFGKAKSTIKEHIKNIFAEGELVEADVTKKFGISECPQNTLYFHNLCVAISADYRVKSHQGAKFRIRETQRRIRHEESFKGLEEDITKLTPPLKKRGKS